MELKPVPTIPSEILNGGASVILIYLGAKFLWPRLIRSESASKTISTVGQSLLLRIEKQLEDAYRQRKEADDRAEEFFVKWSEAEAKVVVLMAQLERTTKEVSDLNSRIGRLENEIRQSKI